MYSPRESQLKGTASAGGVIGGAACQSIPTGPRDLSPIEQQFQRQINLLNELHAVAHNLIDSIKPVLRYDPRESPPPETNGTPIGPGCAMEREIDAHNELLADKVRLLRQVQEIICL